MRARHRSPLQAVVLLLQSHTYNKDNALWECSTLDALAPDESHDEVLARGDSFSPTHDDKRQRIGAEQLPPTLPDAARCAACKPAASAALPADSGLEPRRSSRTGLYGWRPV